MHRRFGTLVLAGVMILAACSTDTGETGPAGADGAAGAAGADGTALAGADLGCTECHDDTTLIAGKTTAWADSLHGTGEAYVRGGSASEISPNLVDGV